MLLAAGADPEQASEFGATPVYVAAGKGHTEALKVLIEAGAQPDRRRDDGTTPALACVPHLRSSNKRKRDAAVESLECLRVAAMKRARHDCVSCPTCRKKGPRDRAHVVFARVTCPVCRDAKGRVLALGCGHVVCEGCMKKLKRV